MCILKANPPYHKGYGGLEPQIKNCKLWVRRTSTHGIPAGSKRLDVKECKIAEGKDSLLKLEKVAPICFLNRRPLASTVFTFVIPHSHEI